jgi:hypothetical protein
MFSEELPDEKIIVLLAPSSNSEKGKRINCQFLWLEMGGFYLRIDLLSSSLLIFHSCMVHSVFGRIFI